MEAESVPQQLIDRCAAYQREVALIHLDTPPGEAREVRLTEALDRVSEVYAPATIEALQSQMGTAPAAHQDALRRLRSWALALHVERALLPVQRELRARQRAAVCLVDDEPIPLHASFAAMAAEPRRERRVAIEAAVCRQLEELHELLASQWSGLTAVAEHLGYATPEALWTDIVPAEPAAFQDIARHILHSTQEVFAELLTWAARRRLRLPPGQLRRHDILALFTFPEYQAYYQPGTVVSSLQTCLRDLGLNPPMDGRLTWRERAAPFGPPEALALHIPDEIVLSYAQVGGVKGAEAFAEASGRALLWAGTAPELPAVNRQLGDPAWLAGNAQLLAELLADPRYLHRYGAVSVDTNYVAWRRLDRLFRLRRHLGRFLYTRHLYTNNSLTGASEAYRDIMMEACLVDYPPAYHLLDCDWQYTTLTTLRGWSLTYAVLELLREEFAADWFRNPDAGEWLRQYWHGALGERLEACRDQLTGSAWDGELFAAVLAHVDR